MMAGPEGGRHRYATVRGLARVKFVPADLRPPNRGFARSGLIKYGPVQCDPILDFKSTEIPKDLTTQGPAPPSPQRQYRRAEADPLAIAGRPRSRIFARASSTGPIPVWIVRTGL
jgi:hypothetical protein